jgi:hypothetical protein
LLKHDGLRSAIASTPTPPAPPHKGEGSDGAPFGPHKGEGSDVADRGFSAMRLFGSLHVRVGWALTRKPGEARIGKGRTNW